MEVKIDNAPEDRSTIKLKNLLEGLGEDRVLFLIIEKEIYFQNTNVFIRCEDCERDVSTEYTLFTQVDLISNELFTFDTKNIEEFCSGEKYYIHNEEYVYLNKKDLTFHFQNGN